jgi:hypothetical protein
MKERAAPWVACKLRETAGGGPAPPPLQEALLQEADPFCLCTFRSVSEAAGGPQMRRGTGRLGARRRSLRPRVTPLRVSTPQLQASTAYRLQASTAYRLHRESTPEAEQPGIERRVAVKPWSSHDHAFRHDKLRIPEPVRPAAPRRVPWSEKAQALAPVRHGRSRRVTAPRRRGARADPPPPDSRVPLCRFRRRYHHRIRRHVRRRRSNSIIDAAGVRRGGVGGGNGGGVGGVGGGRRHS